MELPKAYFMGRMNECAVKYGEEVLKASDNIAKIICNRAKQK